MHYSVASDKPPFSKESHQCNAVLFSRNQILTAMHCVDRALTDPSYKLVQLKHAGAEDVHTADLAISRIAYDKAYRNDLSSGLDLALVTFSSPLPWDVAPPRTAKPSLATTAIIHSILKENKSFHEYSTKLDANRVDTDYSYFQGPGRTGHSGGGLFAGDGRLVGVMSSADGPRRYEDRLVDTVWGSNL